MVEFRVPGRLVLRLSKETVVGAGVSGSPSWSFLGKDTVGYCGLCGSYGEIQSFSDSSLRTFCGKLR